MQERRGVRYKKVLRRVEVKVKKSVSRAVRLDRVSARRREEAAVVNFAEIVEPVNSSAIEEERM